MIRTAALSDLSALRELFGRANDMPYDLDAVAEEKCFGGGIAGAPVVRVIERERRIAGAAVTCGKWLRILAVDRALRGQGIGSRLLEDAQALGARVIAAEPGNYFTPGVIDGGFFVRRGYRETATTWNLEWRADGTPLHSNSLRATDRERTLSFIEREFGRIWRFEAAKAFDRETPTMFVEEHDGEIAGFAAHDVNNRGLGFFGPTGVAKAMRGRGIGCRLLHASLADMRRLGFERVVIPWTDALEFYAKCCGAKPANQFTTFSIDSAP
jgi:N-acetylglutamate synthase-like GNAT family acetyltransferase